jgi:hypothetical protein
VACIHCDRSQSQRNEALQGFKDRVYRILVATDVAARGIHVDDIAHVVYYDLPQEPESFIHRIGRTGRAGAFAGPLSGRVPVESHRRSPSQLGTRRPSGSGIGSLHQNGAARGGLLLVEVLAQGFRYENQHYSSLSAMEDARKFVESSDSRTLKA